MQPATLPVYMGAVPDYVVSDDAQMHIIVANFEIVMPLSVFMLGAAKADKAIAQWQLKNLERPRADIVQIGRGKH